MIVKTAIEVTSKPNVKSVWHLERSGYLVAKLKAIAKTR